MILAFNFFCFFLISTAPTFSISTLTAASIIVESSAPNNQQALDNDSLKVGRFSLVAHINDKQPGDSLDYNAILVGQKVWAYAEFENYLAEQDVLFNWYRNNELYLSYAVKVGTSSLWRTYSYVTARKGEWTLQIKLQESETVLNELNFTVID